MVGTSRVFKDGSRSPYYTYLDSTLRNLVTQSQRLVACVIGRSLLACPPIQRLRCCLQSLLNQFQRYSYITKQNHISSTQLNATRLSLTKGRLFQDQHTSRVAERSPTGVDSTSCFILDASGDVRSTVAASSQFETLHQSICMCIDQSSRHHRKAFVLSFRSQV